MIVGILVTVMTGINLYVQGWIFGQKPFEDGKDGLDGVDGANGKSAYELAVENGFEGTLHEWLVSLAIKGDKGADGKNGQDGSNGHDGVGIADVKVNEDGDLILTLTNGKQLNAGHVGNQGFVSETVDEQGFTQVYETVVMNGEASMLNLRMEPSTSSDIVTSITTGTELLRIGHNHTTGWTRLIWDGRVCYAFEKYFDLKYKYEGEIPEMHLPQRMFLTVGEQTWFMTDAILADASGQFSLGFSYSGKGERIYDGNSAFAITPSWSKDASTSPHSPETETLTVTLQQRVEGEWRTLFSHTVAVTVVEKRTSLELTGVVIGDSRISDGTIVTRLASDLSGLKLLGTRSVKSSGVCHEGRGAWSTANFLKSSSLTLPGASEVKNAFWNPATSRFDFAYYMAENYPNETVDFVVINLGANDGFTLGSVENLQAMTDSIKSYAKGTGKEITVIVMTEYLSPASGFYLTQSSNLDISEKRARQFRYFTYLDEAFGNREEEGIYLLPNYLCIDGWNDRYRSQVTTSSGTREAITDVVHLGRNGYVKEASMIESYLFGIFG